MRYLAAGMWTHLTISRTTEKSSKDSLARGPPARLGRANAHDGLFALRTFASVARRKRTGRPRSGDPPAPATAGSTLRAASRSLYRRSGRARARSPTCVVIDRILKRIGGSDFESRILGFRQPSRATSAHLTSHLRSVVRTAPAWSRRSARSSTLQRAARSRANRIAGSRVGKTTTRAASRPRARTRSRWPIGRARRRH